MKISKLAYEKLKKTAVECKTEEICGLLAGNGKEITDVYVLENVRHSAHVFEMNPMEQFEVIHDIRKKKLSLAGIFHSHIDTMPVPSETDIRLAYDDSMLYVIISAADGEIRAYRINCNAYSEVELIEE